MLKMKNTKITLILSFFLTTSVWCYSQEKININIPDILGYKTLSFDFHLHTIFSDGQVWPTTRVDEAKRDGIDGISITDHIEYRPNLKYFFKDEKIISDHNLPYEIAQDKAASNDSMLIKGAEITRAMPPGHFNAIFLSDINTLDTPWEENIEDEVKHEIKQGWIETGLYIKDWQDAFYNAKLQGAFIYWNHPCWERQQPDTTKWWSEHTWLLNNNLMDGIEVVTGNSYCPEAHQWAIENNLTILAGSDSHSPITGKQTRPLTLIFAESRDNESVKEALIDRRSAIFYNGKLIGDKRFLSAIFSKSISIESVNKTNEGFNVVFQNQSDVQFEISKITSENSDIRIPNQITMRKNNQTILSIQTINFPSNKDIILNLTVDNLLISPQETLAIQITFNAP
jgi:3',5'-nucleoside bisphosphate phosphatase